MVVFQNINIIYEETQSLLYEAWLTASAVFIVFTRVTGQALQRALIWSPGCQRDWKTNCRAWHSTLPASGRKCINTCLSWGSLTQYQTSMATPGICKRNGVKYSQAENRVSEGSLEAKSHRGNEHLFTKSLNLPELFLLPSEMNSPVRTKQVLGWICN